MKTKLNLLLAMFFLLMVACKDKDAEKPNVFSEDGKALKGYDPVAFFKEGKPIKGKQEFTHHYKDADWQFSSETNLNEFKANTKKYEPQYGGYCAYGMSRGYKAPIEIETWSIVDGRLYFNYNKDVKEKWNEDQENYIEKADGNWIEFIEY